MQIFDITVPANSAFVVHAPGRYIKYLSGSNGGGDASLIVQPGMHASSKITLSPGQAYRIGQSANTPDSWTLSNYTNTATIVGKVVVGDGQIDDPTIAGVVQVVDGGKARTLGNNAYAGFALQAAVAAQYGRVQLWNPASNPNRLVVEQIQGIGGTAGQYSLYVFASGAQLATFVQAGQPKKIGGTASAALINTDTTAAAPGVPALIPLSVTGAGAYTIYRLNEPIVIPPGAGILLWCNGVNIAMFGGFEWYEEANV
jgi:hypothetical protein